MAIFNVIEKYIAKRKSIELVSGSRDHGCAVDLVNGTAVEFNSAAALVVAMNDGACAHATGATQAAGSCFEIMMTRC
jgi:hypothetical protein